MSRRVIVGVFKYCKSGFLEQRSVILPAWRADVKWQLRKEPLQEVRPDLERAGSAKRLRGDRSSFFQNRGIPQHERLHCPIVYRRSVDRNVALRILFGEPALFCFAHHAENRYLTLVVLVDAYAKIDLPGIRIGVEGLG